MTVRRIQNQRTYVGPRRETDRHRSSFSAERRIRRAKTGDYLKTWGSRPEKAQTVIAELVRALQPRAGG